MVSFFLKNLIYEYIEKLKAEWFLIILIWGCGVAVTWHVFSLRKAVFIPKYQNKALQSSVIPNYPNSEINMVKVNQIIYVNRLKGKN